MDEVDCSGTESNLSQCNYTSSRHDCSHSEDAGVICCCPYILGMSYIYLHTSWYYMFFVGWCQSLRLLTTHKEKKEEADIASPSNKTFCKSYQRNILFTIFKLSVNFINRMRYCSELYRIMLSLTQTAVFLKYEHIQFITNSTMNPVFIVMIRSFFFKTANKLFSSCKLGNFWSGLR